MRDLVVRRGRLSITWCAYEAATYVVGYYFHRGGAAFSTHLRMWSGVDL
jgi:hypothetical protein